ncbi:MAG: sigma 54-interacting transcriptional regulator [Planctomycetes bacterium]|nr:sigma 54-interacting transcriptional regulator [Planctomycetota bacterium]
MNTNLPDWAHELTPLLPPSTRMRQRDGAVVLRVQGRALRARPGAESEWALRAFAPALFPDCVGVLPGRRGFFLIETFPAGIRLDRRPGERQYQRLAMLLWSMHAAGYTPADIELQRLMLTDGAITILGLPGKGPEERACMALAWARAFVTGRKATAGMRADKLAPLVLRVLGGESALPAMARAKLAQLPDVAAWQSHARSVLDDSLRQDIPRILVAATREQGAGFHALLCEAAVQRGVCAGDGSMFAQRQDVRLIAPTTPADCERRLGRLSPGPTVAIVVGAQLDVSRALQHVGQVSDPPKVTGRGLFEWLRPLGAEASRVVEELVPALEDDPGGAHRTVGALIERAGARMHEGEPVISPDWVEHWQSTRGRRTALSVMRPDAARVAQLIALSPGGLNTANLKRTPELARAVTLLEDLGVAVERGDTLQPAEGTRVPPPDVGARRAMLVWLSEREYLAPDPQPRRRAAWRIGLRMRAGDLACWQDDGAEKLFHELITAHAFTDALQLAESHAAGAVRSDAGPPSMDVLYSTCDMAMALWKPPRLRRLLRMWLRGYTGELRALSLALLARVARTLGGSEGYLPLIDELESLCREVPRLPREQALIEAAHCCAPDDPERALKMLQGVSKHPAMGARYLAQARMHMIHAECGLVRIHIEDAFSRVQQARGAMPRQGLFTRRARLEADIEARHMTTHSMLSFYKVDADLLLQPIRAVQERTGVVGDILRSARVNDLLMRMRLREVGLMTLDEMNGVLAEARPDNLRGYLVAMYQLEECALYRGECGAARQISARISGLSRGVDGDQTIQAGWGRHQGLLHALAGDIRAGLRHWSLGRSLHIPEPWRSRTHMLRRGEWGFMLMLAGKFERAAFWLQQTFDRLLAMSAGGRGSVYLTSRVLCDLLLGNTPRSDDMDYLESLAKHGYVFPRVCKCIADAVAGSLDWRAVADRIDEIPAPDFWRAIGLSTASVIAKRLHQSHAAQLARSARQLLTPEWVVLQRWLDREFPAPASSDAELKPAALKALAAMNIPDVFTPAAFVELACASALRATQAPGAMAQTALDKPATAGVVDKALGDALERALMGETVSEGGCTAISLRTPFGALAVKSSAPGTLASLTAIAHRLAELFELAEARSDRHARKRQGREIVRAAWSLAAGEPAATTRLSGMRALIMAETGATDTGLMLLRGAHELLGVGNPAPWTSEAVHAVDATLRLRVRCVGGDANAVDESTLKAARALGAMLASSTDRLRVELARPGEDEDLLIAGEIAGRSAATRRLHDDLRRFADLDLPIVVTGEPGSGKDLVVRALHGLSTRATHPLVVIDCPTLRRETAASELFGHVAGAFTGATHDHAGLLERAGEGTLQVDGIADLDLSIQAMLLRAFQARTFLPVGGVHERDFRARLVVTTGASLSELVAEGNLREDLAQRLQGVILRVPPLRERGDDALVIAKTVLAAQSRQLNRHTRFSRAAEKHIREHSWPGNVRELKSAVTRAVVMSDGGEIGVAELQAPDIGARPGALLMPADAPGLNVTTRVILGTLRGLGESQSGTLARRLGMSRTTVSTSLSDLARRGFCERLGKGRATRYRAL